LCPNFITMTEEYAVELTIEPVDPEKGYESRSHSFWRVELTREQADFLVTEVRKMVDPLVK